MKVGISCAGIGAGADGGFVRAAAAAAERAGFSTFWLPDHVVLFEHYPLSGYAYGELFEDSPLPDPYTALADPLIGMTWAAAATSTMEVGTSILILPERNPVVLAKELATLDAFAGGRLVLGIGAGWSQEEYGAVGADWARRGRTMDEHIAVMRMLWRDRAATYRGEGFAFERACLNPKPPRDVPIVMGGESEAVLKRIARCGDGWLPYKLPLGEAAERIAHLMTLVRDAGRAADTIRVVAPLFETTSLDDAARFRDAGVTEFYLGVPPPAAAEAAGIADRIAALAERFVAPLAGW